MKQTQGAYTKTRPYWDDMKQRNTSRQMRSTDTTDKKGKVITDHLGHNLKNLQTLLEIPTFGVGESPEARAVIEMFEFALREIKSLRVRVIGLEYAKRKTPIRIGKISTKRENTPKQNQAVRKGIDAKPKQSDGKKKIGGA